MGPDAPILSPKESLGAILFVVENIQGKKERDPETPSWLSARAKEQHGKADDAVEAGSLAVAAAYF